MNKAFEKMLAKKKASDGEMPKQKMEARNSVLDDLMSNMDDRQSKKLGVKKVSVMADSKKGLEEGLDKAKEVIGDAESPEMEEDMEHEASESPEHEMPEHDMSGDMSKEALMAQIEELKEKIARLGV